MTGAYERLGRRPCGVARASLTSGATAPNDPVGYEETRMQPLTVFSKAASVGRSRHDWVADGERPSGRSAGRADARCVDNMALLALWPVGGENSF